MRKNRPGAWSIYSAVCANGEREVNFTRSDSVDEAARMLRPHEDQKGVTVPCRSLTDLLWLVGVNHLTYASIDVQGAELAVVQSIDTGMLNVSVVQMEEVRVNAAKNIAVANWVSPAKPKP
eukprot:7199469-Prymnesium_polylepis.1